MARYNAIDIAAPTAERREQVAALRALELTQKNVQAAASICLEAHSALLISEEEQEQANHALQAASSQGSAKDFTSERAARLHDMIQRSNENVVRARKLFPKCERAVRKLALSFAKKGG
ncbi:MAG: hypothetical protein IPJ88_07335 [Myxococcales bacterium]|nr:MAG: hypothetical protein IPJ88_07335 [Myxococcales bacterium]